MRFSARYALLLLTLLWVSGCGQKGARLQNSAVPPDRTLFETGEEYLNKSQYIKARLAFQTLINTYPDSDLTADSYLAIGDSFYNEGGTESLLQAEDQYNNFIVFFPTSPKAADAQMKIVSLNMKMMRSPDRDQSYAIKAESAIKKMLKQFPDSDYTPIARRYLTDVQEILAQGDFGIGQFYAERGNYAGARSRFREIIDKYPTFSAMDETYFRLAETLAKTGNPDEAAIYYGRIAAGYPFSKHFEESKARLQAMGKPSPPVDSELAAVNLSRQRPAEAFSPLRPLISFAEALGFVGPPDRYEEARKTVEAQRSQLPEVQAAKAGEGEAGDDILIQTILKRDSTGETQETTVLGGNPNATAPSTDKNEEDTKKGPGQSDNKKN